MDDPVQSPGTPARTRGGAVDLDEMFPPYDPDPWRSACRYGARTSTTTEAAEHWMFIDTNVLVRARFRTVTAITLPRAKRGKQ